MTLANPQMEEIERVVLAPDTEAGTAPPQAYPAARIANWALFVFILSLVVNFVDRGILNLLVQPIKRDLQLSDFRVSLLMGPAFVIFYLLLGLPIARLVDSRNRRAIVGFGLACWSLMTAACGLAQGFVSFFCARIGVGVGDACTGPATYSMLADFYPRERLPRAIAFMQLGVMGGVGLAMLIGAAVVEMTAKASDVTLPVIGVVHNWQMVFFVVGIPGLIVALLMGTVAEPKRRGLLGAAAAKGLPLSEVTGFLIQNWRAYLPIFLALAVAVVNTTAAQSWGPTFYQRSFGWEPQKTAVFLGVGTILLTPVGLLLGTLLVEWYHRRGFDDANLRLVRWTTLIALPFPILSPLAPTPWLALAAYLTGITIVAFGTSAENAALQTITPNQMRGQITACYLFVYSIGSGIGPTLVALLTDGLFHDEARVGQAMSLSALVLGPIEVICYWLALKAYGRSVAQAKVWL